MPVLERMPRIEESSSPSHLHSGDGSHECKTDIGGSLGTMSVGGTVLTVSAAAKLGAKCWTELSRPLGLDDSTQMAKPVCSDHDRHGHLSAYLLQSKCAHSSRADLHVVAGGPLE